MNPFHCSRRTALLALPSLASLFSLRAAAGQETNAAFAKMVEKGINYLSTKGQAADGSFTRQAGLGVTGLATTAMLRLGRTPDDPTVKKALKLLEEHVQPNGGVFSPKGRMATYETCVAVLCFSTANKDGRYAKTLAAADKFLKQIPFDAEEGHDKASVQFGGAGYGGPGRPDLSNTAFLVEALRTVGNGADDQAIQNALVFISRCQNLESEHNTTPHAAKINDGGFYYSPVVSDEEREQAAGGLRSYGAMSYSGLKSMVFAGLKKDDPRVKAVLTWVAKHYDLKSNPGMGDAGVYYYYLTFAKALEALGEDKIADEKGTPHDWRQELIAELAARQREDGAWVNTNSRWMEGDANLCTAFALLALSHCVKKSS